MEKIVEIGSEAEKKLIKSELSVIDNFVDQCAHNINIIKLIVADDFDSAVRKVTNDINYQSKRETQTAHAKTIDTDNGTVMIFSKYLFSLPFEVRLIFYTHEFYHAANKYRFPELHYDSISSKVYSEYMYILFDEYYANCKSYELFNYNLDLKNINYKRFISYSMKGLVESLLDDKDWHNYKTLINRIKIEDGLKLYSNELSEYYDRFTKDIVYFYALIDSVPRLKRIEPLLEKSKLINSRTVKLIDYFRIKYSNDDLNLIDGIKYMKDFMINFGIIFKDVPGGSYYNAFVINILE